MRKRIFIVFIIFLMISSVCFAKTIDGNSKENKTQKNTEKNKDEEEEEELTNKEIFKKDSRVIELFDTEIVVSKDGLISVTEKITVDTWGAKAPKGINRILVNDTSKDNNLIIKKVLFDGKTIEYNEKNSNNTKEIVISPSKKMEEITGSHTYEIQYTIENVLTFEKELDSFEWNVVTPDFDCPIKECKASITLPEKAKILVDKTEYDIESDPSMGCDYSKKNVIKFYTNEPLEKEDTFSVRIRFEKGAVDRTLVKAKQIWKQVKEYCKDKVHSLLAIVLFVIFIAGKAVYMLRIRGKLDKHAKKIEYPTKGFEPIDLNYMKFKGNKLDRGFESEILGLIVKGYVQIYKNDEGQIVLRRAENTEQLTVLSEIEKDILLDLPLEFVVDENDKESINKLKNMKKKVKSKSLSKLLKKYYNRLFDIAWKMILATAIVVVISTVVGCFVNKELSMEFLKAFGKTAVASILVLVVAIMSKKILGDAKSIAIKVKENFTYTLALAFITMISVSLVINALVEIYTIGFDGYILLAILFINVIFVITLSGYTNLGINLRNEITGYESYIMDETQSSDYDACGLYLPYAYALEVEKYWILKFPMIADGRYVPVWGQYFVDQNNRFDSTEFLKTVGMISKTLVDYRVSKEKEIIKTSTEQAKEQAIKAKDQAIRAKDSVKEFIEKQTNR